MEQKPSSGGMRAFIIIWVGQLVSLIGSQLTGFALGVWVYEQTHSVLMVALTQVAMQAPFVILSPLAGVLADRWNRRTAMIISDFGAGRGVGVMITLLGLVAVGITLAAFFVRPIRRVEIDLPDHAAIPEVSVYG
jgi:MFS family permease